MTLRAGSSSGSPSPESVASPGWVAAMSVKTVLWRRHSDHSGGVETSFAGRRSAPVVVPDHDETVGVGVRQRADQHRVDGAEHRGVDADAERERGDGDGRERGIAPDLAQAVADVARGSSSQAP